MTQRERFEQYQAEWRQTADALRALRSEIAVRWGNVAWASSKAKKQIAQLDAREVRHRERFWRLLSAISPRDWSHYVPCAWVRDSLTYEDAVTTGELSAYPPPAYGSTPAMVRDALAVRRAS